MLFSEHEFGKDEKFTAVANFGNGIKEYMLSNKVARVDDLCYTQWEAASSSSAISVVHTETREPHRELTRHQHCISQ